MSGERQAVKIRLDYHQGPIWISDVETGEPMTGINRIETDPMLKSLNDKAGQMYDSYYEKEREEKDAMLALITRIVARLNEINDGSFIIEDLEGERLKTL